MIKDIHKAAEDARTYIRQNREILGKIRADDFGYTLKQLMKWSGVNVQVLAERSLISTKTIQRMRNKEDYQASIETIIALCIGMQLPPPVSHRFLKLAGYQIRYSSELLAAYDLILDKYYNCGIQTCTELLLAMGYKELTSSD